MNFTDVLHFWFEEIDKSKWWKKDSDFDQLIRDRFLQLHEQAARCELFSWRSSPQGRLAEVILLDQFSRNMFRDTPKAFEFDPLALILAQEAIHIEVDLELTETQRSFLYMPFMHSESIVIHDKAVPIFERLGKESTLRFELRHKEIIDTFNRYPHRNKILGRKSTVEEIKFLQQPGSSF